MTELESSARHAAEAAPDKEIFPFEYQGERYWLKRARPTGSNLLHHTAWRVTKFPLLTPVRSQSATEALRHETEKIRHLGRQGIAVPKLVIAHDAWFVMTHTGPTLRHLLYRKERNERLTLTLFEALGKLHRAGEYHGGSQLRNLTWDGEKINFIDFEEAFGDTIDRQTLQLRDLFLLLFSFAKDQIPLDYRRHIDRYTATSGNLDFDRRLHRMFAKLDWLEKTIAFPPIWKILDKDTRATYRLIQELKRL